MENIAVEPSILHENRHQPVLVSETDKKAKASELKQAFKLFNQMSQQLTDSYSFLEDRIEQLSGELESVSAQRIQELAEKEQVANRLQALLDLLPAGVVLIDDMGCVEQANPAANDLLLNNSQSSCLIGLKWIDIIDECFKPQLSDGHEISLTDGRLVNLRIAPMQGQPGQIIMLTDMTETRALQSQLAQHERLLAMGKMVASLAHQIRTPLAAASIYAEHLNNPELDTDKHLRFAGKLQERLRHLENQVRDMLIFARGEAPLNDEVTTYKLIENLQAAMEIPIAQYQAQVDIQNEVMAEHTIICNHDALVSSLMNLINNALESGSHPIKLLIRLTQKNQQTLQIEIEDNGDGLSEFEMNKIQSPFYTTKSNGTGLGLAVVQAVVKAHKGEFMLTHSDVLGGIKAQMCLPIIRTEQML